MPTDHPPIFPYAIALLVVFLPYRRLRRRFGRQRVSVTRMDIRIHVPHAHSGIAVSVLRVGRRVYRFVGDHAAAAAFDPQNFNSQLW